MAERLIGTATSDDILTVRRLEAKDFADALLLFELIADVFGETWQSPRASYVTELLERPDAWVVSASRGERIIGGLTAHALPMTNREARELFVYDVAVHSDEQRRGVGRALFEELRRLATNDEIESIFLDVDNDDHHALAFYAALEFAASDVTNFALDTTQPNASDR